MLLHQGAFTSVHQTGLGCIACQGTAKNPVQEYAKHATSAECIEPNLGEGGGSKFGSRWIPTNQVFDVFTLESVFSF